MSRPHEEHRKVSERVLKFALCTVSTSRYSAKISGRCFSDETMDVALRMVREKSHEVVYTDVIDDDLHMIRKTLLNLLDKDVDVIVFMGGTGLTRRDITVEAVRPLLEKEAEGFGEIFRMVSYREIGAAAALTRALAGVVGGKAVLCLPGSPAAVELAFRIFLDEIPHLVYLARQ